MDVEKQREIIRLWNRMRQVEGPIAEEIRIQILGCFAQHALPAAGTCDRRAARGRVKIEPVQAQRMGDRGTNAPL
jgi:hypothetical protein